MPVTIFADLSAPTDALWSSCIFSSMKACPSFDRFETQLRGGALLVPDERVSSLEYGIREDDERRQTSHSRQSSVQFWQQRIRESVATTSPLTTFDTEKLLVRGLYDWDIFTASHVPDDLMGELLVELASIPGFLHAARPNAASELSYRRFWAGLSFVGVVTGGVVLRADWEDDPDASLARGWCEDRYGEEASDAVIVDFYGSLMPERRRSHLPIPTPLYRLPAAEAETPGRIRRDTVTRAVASMPTTFTKSHPFDDPSVPARFHLPADPVDRMTDYFQVERKVRDYCLADQDKARGFAWMGIFSGQQGERALADQLLAVVNHPDGATLNPRLMSDGTVQFEQRLLVSGPTGRVGAVEASWNYAVGRGLQLSSAFRTGARTELSRVPNVPSLWTVTDDWDELVDLIARETEVRCTGTSPYGWVWPFVLLPAGRETDSRTKAFARWIGRSDRFDSSVHQLKRRRFHHVVGLIRADHDADPVARTVTFVDLLRASGVYAYPFIYQS